MATNGAIIARWHTNTGAEAGLLKSSATAAWVSFTGAISTDIPDVSGYAKTSDIPTDDYINSLITTALGEVEEGSY